MNTTRHDTHGEAFEQILLSYAEMCYSVAFALTRHPERAQELARHTLTWAWHRRNGVDAGKDIKRNLLKVLRERFLVHYCQTPCSGLNEPTRREDIPCFAQVVEWNTETASPSAQIVT